MSGLREAFDEIVADVPVYGDLDRAMDQSERERRHRDGLVAGLAAAAAGVAMIVSVLAVTGDEDDSPEPAVPSPTERSRQTTEWKGPIPAGTLPVVSDQRLGPVGDPWRGWTDPKDSAVRQIDIRVVAGWGLKLEEDARLEQWLDDEGRIVEYGIVADSDGDRTADCQLTLSTDAPGRGRSPQDGPLWRVVLTNLDSGERDARVGPPYGYPFEFGFADTGPNPPSIYFEFLGTWQPPCEVPRNRIRWYAYSSLTEDGRVTAWDFAPDRAWLQTRPDRAVQFGGQFGQTYWGRNQ